jgi:hypothetical protein
MFSGSWLNQFISSKSFLNLSPIEEKSYFFCGNSSILAFGSNTDYWEFK